MLIGKSYFFTLSLLIISISGFSQKCNTGDFEYFTPKKLIKRVVPIYFSNIYKTYNFTLLLRDGFYLKNKLKIHDDENQYFDGKFSANLIPDSQNFDTIIQIAIPSEKIVQFNEMNGVYLDFFLQNTDNTTLCKSFKVFFPIYYKIMYVDLIDTYEYDFLNYNNVDLFFMTFIKKREKKINELEPKGIYIHFLGNEKLPLVKFNNTKKKCFRSKY